MKLLTGSVIKKTLALLPALFLSINSYADYHLVSAGGAPHVFNVDFINGEIENVAGAELTKSWNLGSAYSVRIYCQRSTIFDHSFYYQALTSLPRSDINPGFLKLNEYLDAKFEIWTIYDSRGQNGIYRTVPFYDADNRYVGDHCTAPYSTLNARMQTGGMGRITVRLRKRIINGASIQANHTIELFGRLSPGSDTLNSSYGSEPIVRVIFSAGDIVVPDTCIVNGGEPVEVDFGAVGEAKLDGEHYKQPFSISYDCKGGSFDRGIVNIRMSIQGSASSFNADYLKTSTDNLGIRLISANAGSAIVPGRFYPLSGNSGQWQLIAAPIANGKASIAGGSFNSSATIISEFE